MAKTITQDNDAMAQANLRAALTKIQSQCDAVLNSAGLAIHGSASALAKIANTITCFVNGILLQKTTADLPALAGASVPNGSFNIYVFTIASDGTLGTLNGTPGATLAAVVVPTIPANVAVIGCAVISNGTGSAFTPGTTALDTASLTVTYINTIGDFSPNMANL